jgi:signal transduction histidine kinase
MEFRKLAPRLRLFVIACAIAGSVCALSLFFSVSHVSLFHLPHSPVLTTCLLGVLFWIARKFHFPLESHVSINCGTIIITSAFFICGPWILLPLIVSGLISDLLKGEKAWSIILNASCDAIRVIPGSFLFTFAGGDFAFSRLTAAVLLSSSAFFLWLIASDFMLLYLFAATGSDDKPALKKLDLIPSALELIFFPLSLLTVLIYANFGLPYLLLIAVPLAGALFLYQYGLGKKTEVEELSRLNRDLIALSREKTELLAESERRTMEIKRIHGHLLQSEKLASIGKLAAGLAHELNTPLGAILTNAEFALSFADDRDMEESLQMIKKGSLRCKNITESLLAYSRKEELKMTMFPLSQAIEEALAELEPLMKDVAISVEINADSALQIYGIHDSIIQILDNGLRNAIDAIISERRREGKITINGTSQGDMALVSIKDNGAGMTSEIMERIFDPFFTTKDVGKGTGLGLWITRHMAEMQRGKIFVRSAPGEGSEFILEIPAKGTVTAREMTT